MCAEDEVWLAHRAVGLLLRSPALDARLYVVPHETPRSRLFPARASPCASSRGSRRPARHQLAVAPSRAIAQDSSDGIQRRLDQVVDVPCFVAIPSGGKLEVDADDEPADQGKLSQQGGSNCFGDGRLPACLTVVAYVAGRAVMSKATRHACSATPALGLVTGLADAWVGGGGATM